MRVLLIRHGETDHNASGTTLGRADVPLNERGVAQARAVASLANGSHLLDGGLPVAAVYSSPLRRAVATAAPLAEALGLAIETEPRLIEMDVGELEGIGRADVLERYPEFLQAWLSDDLADARMPGGETLREVQARGWAAIGELSAQHLGETIVAVTHNFVILSLLCRAINLPLAQFRGLRHDLAAVSVLDITPERINAVTLNDRCHLLDGQAGFA